DLVDRIGAADQVAALRRVDAVVARPGGGRRGDAHVHFLRAVLLEHADDLFRRRAAHDRVVDQHHALSRHELAYRIELHLHAEVADGLFRLDERPADIVVTYEAELEGDARFQRVA